jgi:hypothetical protein
MNFLDRAMDAAIRRDLSREPEFEGVLFDAVAVEKRRIARELREADERPVYEIRPYTYTDRHGVASLAYELVDGAGKRIGVYEDCPAAEWAAHRRDADVRRSWNPR